MRNHLPTTLLLFFLSVTVTFIPATGSASSDTDPIGTVVAVRGVAKATSADGKKRQLSIKAPIYKADAIETGARGRIQLLFTDNTIMSLGNNTQMKIAEYQWSKTAAANAALKTQVKEGTFRVLGGAITRTAPQNFTTETPTATIGIRGSSYAGKATPGHLSVVLLGGKGVNIYNDKGMQPITRVGFGTMVAAGQPPMKAFKFTPQDLKGLNGSINGSMEEKPQEQISDEEDQTSAANATNGEGEDQTAATETPTETAQNEEDQTASATTPEEGAAPAPAVETAGEDSGGSESPTLISGDITTEDAPPTELPPFFEPIPPQDSQITSLPTEVLTITDIPPTETTVTVNVTSSIPSDGVEGFSGWLQGTGYETDGSINTIDDHFITEVNWHNHKFIGMVDKTVDPLDPDQYHGGPVFYFGTVNSDGTITNTKIIGSDTSGDDYTSTPQPSIINGYGTSGQFIDLGTDFTFGFTAAGNVKILSDLSVNETWNINGTGLSEGIAPGDESSPVGTVSWKGFVTGLSEDITDPDIGRRLFMNNTSSAFTMNINRDTGTVGGSFSAGDYSGSGSTINVNIGGNGSAYVLDDNLIALLDGSVTQSVNTRSLLPGTNYLVTENPDTPLAKYVEWGIWEAAYIDPVSTTKVYDVHFPGTFWVAGVPTAAANIPTTGSASYQGKAIAAKIDNATLTRLEGTSSFNINFSASSISGSINIPGELALNFDPVSFSGGEFSTSTPATGSNTTSCRINGASFGPSANSVGGNFTATVSTADFLGVFGADRL